MRVTPSLIAFMLLLVLAFSIQRNSQARPLRSWTITELIQNSDVVIIGRFQSWEPVDAAGFADDTERSLFAGETGSFLRGHIVARDATFSVEGVVKGERLGTRLHVLVYDHTTEIPEVEDGFRFFPRELAQASDAPPLLVFLKRAADDRYRPTTGDMDALDSFNVLVPLAEWTALQQAYHRQMEQRDVNDIHLRRLEELRKKVVR